MRITQHSGRTGSGGRVLGTAHNDRNFEREKADNLLNDGQENIYIIRGPHGYVYNGGQSFEQAEHDFYARYLQKDLERQNERAIKARHKERVQDIDQYRKSRKHCPEEVILQIGSTSGTVEPEVFRICLRDYLNEMQAATRGHCFTLDVAIHLDEAVPHAHVRRVWLYQDKDGILCTGQEKALQQLGFETQCLRPGRENDSRYCNRKIAFDAVMREKWLDICERHGVEVEREPVPDGHHNKSKEEMIQDKYIDALDVIARAERLLDTMESHADIIQLFPGASRERAREALRALSDELER